MSTLSGVSTMSKTIGKTTGNIGHGTKSAIRSGALARHGGAAGSSAMEEGEGESGAAGGAGSKGGDSDPQPIPREFLYNTITFTLTMSTMIEFSSDTFKYLYTGSTLAQLFSNSQTEPLQTYSGLMPLMKLSKLKQRFSNFIFLLDEISALGSTPVTTTAITPQMYFLHFHPCDSHAIRYSLTPYDTVETDLTWSLSAATTTPRDGPLVNMETINATEGTDVLQMAVDFQTIAATALFSDYGAYTADNIQKAIENKVYPRCPNIMDRKQYSIVNPGDVLNLPVKTLANGPWIDTTANIFRATQSGANTSYYHYPTRTHPLGQARNKFIANLDEQDSLKGFLHHHFFTCPPIKKSDGSILKQRVSGLYEAEMHVTLKMREDNTAGLDNNLHVYDYCKWHPSTLVTATANRNFWQ